MRLVRVGAGTIVLTLLAVSVTGAQIPPDDRYLTFETAHFRVIFPEHLEVFAREAAASAEWAHAALSRAFVSPPGGMIGLVISDNIDSPNASATPLPRNRMTLLAIPDIGTRQLNYYTDWLDVTLAHELTHIFHFDRAEGVFWKPLRFVFGRAPLLFPAFYQPRWVIEGLATYYESRLTGAGRAHGSFFDMLLSTAATGGSFRSVDAANGLSPTWPSGSSPYAYGSLYFQSLGEQHGDSAVGEFVRRGAGRLPYTVEWAATPAFGKKLSALWDDWTVEVGDRAASRADSIRALGATSGRPLSEFSWQIPSPRFSPDGRLLVYSLIDPREDPATVVIDVESGEVVRRTRRNGSGPNAWSADGSTVYVQQPEFRGRYSIYTDLYTLDVASGREGRLTRGTRLSQPDLHPDRRTLLAIEMGAATNRLVLYDLDSGAISPLTAFVDTVNWHRPRWSPDGRSIAVGRWVRGGIVDIVLLDERGRLIRQITQDEAADVVPAWSPDGRYLLWSSDRDGLYDIFGVDLAAALTSNEPLDVRRVTRTLGGAFDPDISPDGRWLAYAAQHADGYRVEVVPFEPAGWVAGLATRRLGSAAHGSRAERSVSRDEAPTRGYSPFPSIWPTSWIPIVVTGGSAGTLIGASTAGTDYINRHTVALLAGWRTGVENVEAVFAYLYAGFGQPTMRLTLAQEWERFTAQTESGTTFPVKQRERKANLAATFFYPHIRSAFVLVPSIGVDWITRSSLDPMIMITNPSFTDLEARLVLGYSRARDHPRSVSLENGYIAQLSLKHERFADDLDRWRVSAEAVLSGYQSFRLFGYANHVLAARVAGGASSGKNRGAELFDVGGAPGRPFTVISGVDIGGGADYPVRGFSEGVQRGDRIAAANLEYRFPLALVGRGYKLWPFLIDRFSAVIFGDAGAAWLAGEDPDVLGSAGAELALDLGLGYTFVTRFRLGLARQLAVPPGAPKEWQVYLAAGVGF